MLIKNVKFEYLEEVFTTSYWMMRIYKDKPIDKSSNYYYPFTRPYTISFVVGSQALWGISILEDLFIMVIGHPQTHGYESTTQNPCHQSQFTMSYIVNITIGQQAL